MGTPSSRCFVFTVILMCTFHLRFSSDIIHSKYDSSVVFATLLVVQWLGAVVIAVNAKLLKVDMYAMIVLCDLAPISRWPVL